MQFLIDKNVIVRVLFLFTLTMAFVCLLTWGVLFLYEVISHEILIDGYFSGLLAWAALLGGISYALKRYQSG